MRLVNASHLIGCGGSIKQSEPIRNKLGAWRGVEGHRGTQRGHRGGVEGCRGAWKGCRGAQRGVEGYMKGAHGGNGGVHGGVQISAEGA